jgi:hypothetical protein
MVVTCWLVLALWLVTPSQTLSPPAQPTPDKPIGSLRVKTDISDVQLFLDDQPVGRTPLTLREVVAGPHRLTLIKDGYEDQTQPVVVSSGKTTSVFVVMKPSRTPLPEFPVEFKAIHQHRFGYCVGILTVTADAIDFKAQMDTDTFHIPIKEIRSVSRSWGPTVGVTPAGINAPTDAMACRIEGPGRAYGFLAYKDTIGEQMSAASERTKELFDIVYRLWTATLKAPEKSGQN